MTAFWEKWWVPVCLVGGAVFIAVVMIATEVVR